jgi:hypothetical protein
LADLPEREEDHQTQERADARAEDGADQEENAQKIDEERAGDKERVGNRRVIEECLMERSEKLVNAVADAIFWKWPGADEMLSIEPKEQSKSDDEKAVERRAKFRSRKRRRFLL